MSNTQEYAALWQAVLARLNEKILDLSVNLWFSDASLIALDGDVAIIYHPSEYKKSIITTRYLTVLEDTFSEVLGGQPIHVLIHSKTAQESPGESGGGKTAEPSVKAETPSTKPAAIGGMGKTAYPTYNDEYTFDNFVVGSSNKLAHAACTAVAKNPAQEYNPLFIHGASGLGKTHLLYAIMNEIRRNNPNMVILYVKGDDFTNQMIESISMRSQDRFRAKYRKADVLLIDDIQFIAGKESTQEEFFHTFNALYDDRKQIIMTSDRPPRDIKTLEDRLKTRFEWGLIVDIQPPDFELRIAIMKNKAALFGVSLPDDVMTFIAENLKSSIRQIEGAIKRIRAHAFLTDEPVTMELARKAIASLVMTSDPPEVTARKVVDTVSRKYGIPTEEIYGRKRTKPISAARNVSIYTIRKITPLSLVAIAQMFERDHTTVMSALRSVEAEIQINPLLDIEINDMIKEITE